MLLFIKKVCLRITMIFNFNTSHVTVYHICRFKRLLNLSISIHLMLLFIVEQLAAGQTIIIFQYISCYCLSLISGLFQIIHLYFNTSHVTVYHPKDTNTLCLFLISIHLMLLFIHIVLPDEKKNMHFNTSHVTVYLTS